eukprot:jgi/Mesvir1/27511/Mv07277-RA.1
MRLTGQAITAGDAVTQFVLTLARSAPRTHVTAKKAAKKEVSSTKYLPAARKEAVTVADLKRKLFSSQEVKLPPKAASRLPIAASRKPAACGQSPNSFKVLMMQRLDWFSPQCEPEGSCPWGDTALSCCGVQGNISRPPDASMCEDAVFYHVPNLGPNFRPTKPRPDVAVVAFSLEGATNYPLLNNKLFMDLFDVEMTYRVTSPILPTHIGVPYAARDIPVLLDPSDATKAKGFFRPPVATGDKVRAIAFLNSNCKARNGRENLVRRLMGSFPVHAYGSCLHNQPNSVPLGSATRLELFSNYRLCISMENSNSVDYVTEKVYAGLTGGCLPLYMGAPNVQDYLPYDASRMIIDRNAFATEDLFFREIQRVMESDAAYEEYMAWKKNAWAGKPFHPAFVKTFVGAYEGGRTPMCKLCRWLASRKGRGEVAINKIPAWAGH